ncbi:NTP transferase domain-containing protein [bacterium]|nr:NTP transferase domain-containing protein [bacterium]
MKAVLLAAGKGARMQGLCDTLPKPLVPVGNLPVLAHTLRHLADAGVEEALLVIGHQADRLREALGARCEGVRLHYVVQEEPKGTGQATALAEAFADGEPFFMMFGDIVTSRRHIAEIVRVHETERPDAVLSVHYFRDPASGGAVYIDGQRVSRIVERPKPGDTTTHYINAGIFVFPPEIFDLLRQVDLSPRGEYELTDAIRLMLDAGRTVRAFDLERFWVNVTDPATCVEAQRELFAEAPPAAEAPEGVAVEGAVALGADCSLGACRLGPNVSIGDGCAIGDGADVREAIVMAGATIGAGAVVRSAVVGMGACVGEGKSLAGDEKGAAVLLHGQTC